MSRRRSELRCPECGAILQITAVIDRRIEVYLQEGNAFRVLHDENDNSSTNVRCSAHISHRIPDDIVDKCTDMFWEYGLP